MKIGIIGCGAMGTAFAEHFTKGNEVFLYGPDYERIQDLAHPLQAKACKTLGELAKEATALVLAVKPKQLDVVADDIAGNLHKEHLILSVLASTTVSQLEEAFPSASVFRLMPNLPLIYGEGIVGVVDVPGANKEHQAQVSHLLKDLGLITWLPETLIDPLTAISGSGPAFVLLMIEALIEAGIKLGFKAQESQKYALQTMKGAVSLLERSEYSPDQLKWQIASPGGITIAGLYELEKEAIKGRIMRGIIAAYNQGAEHKLDM